MSLVYNQMPAKLKYWTNWNVDGARCKIKEWMKFILKGTRIAGPNFMSIHPMLSSGLKEADRPTDDRQHPSSHSELAEYPIIGFEACSHLVISPPPPRRSAMSRPSSACALIPPPVVMVTSLLPTSQVIVRPPARRNSAMGDLREAITMFLLNSTNIQTDKKKKMRQIRSCTPLGQGGEVGKDISCHHVQAGLCELQVDGL